MEPVVFFPDGQKLCQYANPSDRSPRPYPMLMAERTPSHNDRTLFDGHAVPIGTVLSAQQMPYFSQWLLTIPTRMMIYVPTIGIMMKRMPPSQTGMRPYCVAIWSPLFIMTQIIRITSPSKYVPTVKINEMLYDVTLLLFGAWLKNAWCRSIRMQYRIDAVNVIANANAAMMVIASEKPSRPMCRWNVYTLCFVFSTCDVAVADVL